MGTYTVLTHLFFLEQMGDNMYTTWRALLSALPMYAVRDGVRVLDFASTMPENLGRGTPELPCACISTIAEAKICCVSSYRSVAILC